MAEPIKLYRIAELAKEFGVSHRTLRFYEQKKLISPARSGHTRRYSEADRTKLLTILKYSRMGFTLMRINDRPIGKADLDQQLANLKDELERLTESIALVEDELRHTS